MGLIEGNAISKLDDGVVDGGRRAAGNMEI